MYKKIALLTLLSVTLNASSASNEDAPSSNLTDNSSVSTSQQLQVTEKKQKNIVTTRKKLAQFVTRATLIGSGILTAIRSYKPKPRSANSLFTPHAHVGFWQHTGVKKNSQNQENVTFSWIERNSYGLLCTLFDGIKTPTVAAYAHGNLHNRFYEHMKTKSSEQALRDTYISFDEKLPIDLGQQVSQESGTTALSVLINDSQIIVANAGDSRALLVSNNQIVPLSKDHTLNNPDERKHVLEKTISWPHKEGLVSEFLPVTRALGFHKLIKEGGSRPVIAEPHIYTCKRTDKDQFLLLATGGVFKKKLADFDAQNFQMGLMENEEATTIVQNALENGLNAQGAAHNLITATRANRWDADTSVIVIPLKKYTQLSEESAAPEERVFNRGRLAVAAVLTLSGLAARYIMPMQSVLQGQ